MVTTPMSSLVHRVCRQDEDLSHRTWTWNLNNQYIWKAPVYRGIYFAYYCGHGGGLWLMSETFEIKVWGKNEKGDKGKGLNCLILQLIRI